MIVALRAPDAPSITSVGELRAASEASVGLDPEMNSIPFGTPSLSGSASKSASFPVRL